MMEASNKNGRLYHAEEHSDPRSRRPDLQKVPRREDHPDRWFYRYRREDDVFALGQSQQAPIREPFSCRGLECGEDIERFAI